MLDDFHLAEFYLTLLRSVLHCSSDVQKGKKDLQGDESVRAIFQSPKNPQNITY